MKAYTLQAETFESTENLRRMLACMSLGSFTLDGPDLVVTLETELTPDGLRSVIESIPGLVAATLRPVD